MDTVTSFPASSDPAELIEHVAVDHAIVAQAFAQLSTGELEELRLELIQSSQKADPSGAKGELRGTVIKPDILQVEENMEGGLTEEVEGAEVVVMKIED